MIFFFSQSHEIKFLSSEGKYSNYGNLQMEINPHWAASLFLSLNQVFN